MSEKIKDLNTDPDLSGLNEVEKRDWFEKNRKGYHAIPAEGEQDKLLAKLYSMYQTHVMTLKNHKVETGKIEPIPTFVEWAKQNGLGSRVREVGNAGRTPINLGKTGLRNVEIAPVIEKQDKPKELTPQERIQLQIHADKVKELNELYWQSLLAYKKFAEDYDSEHMFESTPTYEEFISDYSTEFPKEFIKRHAAERFETLSKDYSKYPEPAKTVGGAGFSSKAALSEGAEQISDLVKKIGSAAVTVANKIRESASDPEKLKSLYFAFTKMDDDLQSLKSNVSGLSANDKKQLAPVFDDAEARVETCYERFDEITENSGVEFKPNESKNIDEIIELNWPKEKKPVEKPAQETKEPQENPQVESAVKTFEGYKESLNGILEDINSQRVKEDVAQLKYLFDRYMEQLKEIDRRYEGTKLNSATKGEPRIEAAYKEIKNLAEKIDKSFDPHLTRLTDDAVRPEYMDDIREKLKDGKIDYFFQEKEGAPTQPKTEVDLSALIGLKPFEKLKTNVLAFDDEHTDVLPSKVVCLYSDENTKTGIWLAVAEYIPFDSTKNIKVTFAQRK